MVTGTIPGFSQPPSMRLDPDLPGQDPTQPPGTMLEDQDPQDLSQSPIPIPPMVEDTAGGGWRDRLGLGARRREPASSDTSVSRSEREPEENPRKLTGELVAALLGVTVLLAAGLVRRRVRGARLREPTDKQLAGVGEPIGRILARHVDVAWLNKDLVDAVRAGGALTGYINEGPLLLPDYDAGVPADLQGDEG